MVLNEVFFSLPKLKEPMKRLLDDIVLKKAKEGRKDAMWQDPEKYPAIADIDLVCVIRSPYRPTLTPNHRLFKQLRQSS